MTWLLSVLIALACIGGIIFIPYWISVTIFGESDDLPLLVDWLLGSMTILCIVAVIAIIVLSSKLIHGYLF